MKHFMLFKPGWWWLHIIAVLFFFWLGSVIHF
jgi:hypothetical protein